MSLFLQGCYLWFFAFPMLMVVAIVFPEYHRLKVSSIYNWAAVVYTEKDSTIEFSISKCGQNPQHQSNQSFKPQNFPNASESTPVF